MWLFRFGHWIKPSTFDPEPLLKRQAFRMDRPLRATPPQINEEWFIHHPDTTPSSAVWWFGTHSTGCLDYTNAPDC